MCGRYALIASPGALRAQFGYRDEPDFPPRYNIAPTQPVPVIVRDRSERRFVLMRWGFIPGFVKDPRDFPLVVNVRSETAFEKASFRAAITRRRCLMPADGFYQWQDLGTTRRPFLIRRADRRAFAFAALFETWSGADGSEIDTAAILTTGAGAALAAIQDRAPVVLPDERAIAQWLDPASQRKEVEPLLVPPRDDGFEILPISSAVNKASRDDPSVQEIAPPQP
jgi:putative SOS response-associated peptidase YedK